MQNDSYQNAQNTDSLSFRELVQSLRIYRDAIWKNKLVFISCIFIALSYFVWKALKDYKKFEAQTSFMINENEGGGSLSSLLGQFGGILGVGSDQVNLEKILELAKTMRIGQAVFFTQVQANGKTDFLANHMIQEWERVGLWGKVPFYVKENPLKNFKFQHSKTDSFSLLENSALKQVHFLFKKMMATSSSEETGIMNITITSGNESIAYHSCNTLFEKLSNFYIDKTIEKQKETYESLSRKVDSLKQLMSRKEYSLAGIKDSYRSSWLSTEEVPKTLLDRDIKMIQLIYAEAVKNMELASFSLENKTPFIQAIDHPILPLKTNKESLLKNILLGLVLGCLIGAVVITAKTFYSIQMNQQ
ncbi:MAG TPA: hypothetical protein PK006_00165 [Saprospiraceae bacterium]|nr:hypothetical protein [Saprospiraceae bacterium]